MYERVYIESASLISAFMLDIAIGDPKWFPHPVRGIGWGIGKMEGILRGNNTTGYGREDSGYKKRMQGILLVIIIVGSTYTISYFINSLLLTINPSLLIFNFLLLTYLTSTTLATHELIKSARSVINSLKVNNIDEARVRLSHIVGRDTEKLDREGILKATIETVAENTSDGIIAPLFYFVIGGLPLAMTYKAINTLDSMVGYKNERYKDFGWASAKLDDIANYIPARITGLLIVMATAIIAIKEMIRGGKGQRAKNKEWVIVNPLSSLKIMLRDRRKHPSPNSGVPESAMAGALGIRLGGASTYGGIVVDKPYIGEERNRDYLTTSNNAIDIAKVVSLLGVGIAVTSLLVRGL